MAAIEQHITTSVKDGGSVEHAGEIIDQLDIWSSAIKAKSAAGRGTSKKIDLYGIKKLRELILELAVRGILVDQDSEEEPASFLLGKITVQKNKLIKEKKIPKHKALPVISDKDKLFAIPQGWEWVRLADLGNIFNGNSVNARIKEEKYSNAKGLPFIATKDVGYGFEDFVFDNGIAIPSGEPKFKVAHKNSVLICAEGGSAGKKCGVTDRDICFGNKLFAIELWGNVASKYILTTYLTPTFFRQFSESMTGIIGGISRSKFMELLVPLPPHKEQQRIVTKVEELMSLCEQLEKQQEYSYTSHKILVETLLTALTNAANKGEFNKTWVKIVEHFDVLFTNDHSIDLLKHTVLQLAVMGKLVPQEHNAEPIVKILDKIADEKEKKIRNKKIKKSKAPISFDGLDDLKCEVPKNWAWVRLNDIADIVRGGSPRPAGDLRYYDGEIPFLKVGDITRNSGKFVEGYNATIKEAGLVKTRYIKTRTVLLSNSGATLGIPAICEFPTTFNDGIAAFIEKSKYIFDEYLYLYLKSLSKWFLDVASKGQGQPNLNTDIIKSTWFALPPLDEQHRIVSKVDELMLICENLKSCHKKSKEIQCHLSDAIIFNVFGYDVNKLTDNIAGSNTMKIYTSLSIGAEYNNQGDAILAAAIEKEGGKADAKIIWSKTKLDLPAFYKQLKKEIKAGFVAKPPQAEFEG